MCTETVDSALRSARVVAGYLLHKCGNSKANKTSHDTDYKAILETFVSDLTIVLYLPEWPAASLYLGVISRLMVGVPRDSADGR
jgi:cohesin loading factor subunit SCC2